MLLAMHATTRTATPAFSYLTKEAKAMDFVRELRAAGHACYFTMDAGPNAVLCLEKDLDQLVPLFDARYRTIVSKTKDPQTKTKYQVQTSSSWRICAEYSGYGAVIQFIPIYLSATIQEANSLLS